MLILDLTLCEIDIRVAVFIQKRMLLQVLHRARNNTGECSSVYRGQIITSVMRCLLSMRKAWQLRNYRSLTLNIYWKPGVSCTKND